MFRLLFWLILLVLCWPLALLVLVLYPLIWLLALPFCGATAAFLAWRSQGSRVTRILAALAPSLVWLASIPVVKLILICFPNVFAAEPISSLALAAIGWSVLPALALFVGAVPFLMIQRPQLRVE